MGVILAEGVAEADPNKRADGAGAHSFERGEVQAHGLLFEDWVREEFFGGAIPESYTSKWDIPASRNILYGGIPANPKATKYGAPVGLGDALRQFDIAEPFLLIVAYWQQEADRKRFVKAVAIRVEPERWRALWGSATRADLERIDAAIKDRSISPEDARSIARELKSSPAFADCVFTLNPKIDRFGQRRLQCSLPFNALFQHLAPGVDPSPEEAPKLFGKPLPGPFASPPRSLKPLEPPRPAQQHGRGSEHRKP